MQKKWADRTLLAVFIVLAVLLFGSTASYPGIAQTTSARYVRFLAVFMGILCTAQLVFGLARDHGSDLLKLTDHWGRFLSLLAGLVVFALLFEPLGFYLSAAVFIPVISWALGYRRPIVIGLTTFGLLGFVWVVFVQLLSVRLPGVAFL